MRSFRTSVYVPNRRRVLSLGNKNHTRDPGAYVHAFTQQFERTRSKVTDQPRKSPTAAPTSTGLTLDHHENLSEQCERATVSSALTWQLHGTIHAPLKDCIIGQCHSTKVHSDVVCRMTAFRWACWLTRNSWCWWPGSWIQRIPCGAASLAGHSAFNNPGARCDSV